MRHICRRSSEFIKLGPLVPRSALADPKMDPGTPQSVGPPALPQLLVGIEIYVGTGFSRKNRLSSFKTLIKEKNFRSYLLLC